MKHTSQGWRLSLIIVAAFAMLGAPAKSAGTAWADVVKQAETEGTVVVAGPPIAPYRLSILEFQKAYPKIRLQYTGIADTDFEAKIKTERQAGLHLWDIRIAGVSSTVFTEQIPAHWFAPIRPLIVQPDVVDNKKWLGGFEAGFLDNGKQYAYAFQAGLGGNIFVDRAAIPVAKLARLQDLTDPQWKGKIAMIDPRVRGGTSAITQIMVVAGEKAACDVLSNQDAVLTTTPRQLDEWAMTGRYPITLGMSPSEWKDWQSKGFGKDVQQFALPPKERSWTAGWGAILLMDQAPDAAAAKVFVNWMLSRDEQADWASRGYVNSRRTDVRPGLAETEIDLDTFKNGLTFNTEKSAGLALKAAAIADRCLK